VARTVAAWYDGCKLKCYSGEVAGRIAPAPAGSGGFGWDRVFIPDRSERSFGEMDADEKQRYSMRRLAYEKMSADLHL
jgi:inosine/xanthosine triphosphate pyrophosphatase family protein